MIDRPVTDVQATNPCKADLERRERANNDCALVERIDNHTAHPEACGGGGHGRHGMNLRFVLIGPHGARCSGSST